MMDYDIIDAIYAIPQSEIMVDPGFNCRSEFTPQSIHNLSKSIHENGLLEPLIIQPIGDLPESERPQTDAKYRIIAGHRREAAIRLFLKWETLPCRIVNQLTPDDAKTLNFIENLEREDLGMIEEAEALQRVWSDLSDGALAKQIKRPIQWVRARRKLLKFPDEIKEAVAGNRLNQYDVDFIGKAKTTEHQLKLFDMVLNAKKTGKNVRYKKFHYRNKRIRKQAEIERMITYLLEYLPKPQKIASTLAWASNHIDTQEYIERRLEIPFHPEKFYGN